MRGGSNGRVLKCWAAGTSVWIAAVKQARFCVFIVSMLKEIVKVRPCVCSVALLCELDQFMKYVNNAADAIFLFVTSSLLR